MKRVLPGLILAACWLALLLSGIFALYWAVILVLSILGGHEYLKMVMNGDGESTEIVLLSLILALPVAMTGLWYEDGLCAGLFFSFFLLLCLVLSRYSRVEDGFGLFCKLVLGIVYVGFLTSHLVLLWFFPEGNLWLIILVAITAGSDSGAYYFGKKCGKHKLCPAISPNKTIEGAVGGLICGVIVAALFGAILLEEARWIVLLPMAALLTGIGILGDLCESIIKRGTDTKDSGTILFGHGGILDRTDSMILAAPLLYYMLILTH